MTTDPRVIESSSPQSALSILMACFEQPLDQARAAHAAGAAVVGVTAHAVPWEILSAAGVVPVVIRPTRRGGRHCEEFLEPNVFSPRARSLFESAMAGDLAFLSSLIFARTSEQDYKTYLYLREVLREARGDTLPPLCFYDLLHSPSEHAKAYGLARTRELAAQLESLTGRVIRRIDLEEAIAQSNAARAAVRRLLSLRQGVPRLRGSEALALTGAFHLMDRGRYERLARSAATEAEKREPVTGARLVVCGAWLDHGGLHALLEAEGAVVVAEDGPWGTRAAGSDISTGGDLILAIFEKYYRDGPSVRQWPSRGRTWLHNMPAAHVDGVVFYLPPDDSVMGWDYPIEQRRLEALGLTSLVIRDDLDDPEMAGRWQERIATFVRRANREC